jgi:hypothetical protein
MPLNIIPTFLLKACLNALICPITTIVNLSLAGFPHPI